VPDIQVISFDLDNTLWDVDSVIRNAEAEMRAWLHKRVPEFDSLSGEQMKQIRQEVITMTPALAHDLSALRKAVLENAIALCGYRSGEAKSLGLGAFEVFYEARQQVAFFEGAIAMLDDLAGQFRLGALTNGNANIDKVGLSGYFSFAFSAADVGISKPAPDMFHAALRHCQVNAADAIHVGDNLIDDIKGAAQLGIHTIWTNHADESSEDSSHPPTETVDHLNDLPGAVESIRAR
jgi:putative hydrolase of the HAD superfamily